MIESGSFVADVSATTWEQTGNRFFRAEFESCGPADYLDATTGALKSEQL